MTRNEDVRVWGREVYTEEPEVWWRQHKTITRAGRKTKGVLRKMVLYFIRSDTAAGSPSRLCLSVYTSSCDGLTLLLQYEVLL
jgi:hypothetical protein